MSFLSAPQPRPQARPAIAELLDRLQDALPLSAADRAEAARAALAARPDPAALRRDLGPAAADDALWAERLFGRPAQSRPSASFRRSLETQLLGAQAAALASAPAASRSSRSPISVLPAAASPRALRPLVLGLGSLCLAAFLVARPSPLPAALNRPPTAFAATAVKAPTGTDTPRARATATSQQLGRADGTAPAGG